MIKKLFFAFFSCILAANSFGQCNAYFDFAQIQNTVYFDDTSTAPITSIHWDFGDGDSSNIQNPQHTYLYSDTFIVCATVTDSVAVCTDTFCDTVIITCSAGFSYTIDAINQAMFADESFGNNFKWSWDFGDGSIDSIQFPSHVYNSAGTYYVCLTVLDTITSCTDMYCNNVVLPCQAGYTPFPSFNNTVFFVDSSYGNASEWLWDFGDGTTDTLQNPIHVFPGTGDFVVCLSIQDSTASCVNLFCDTINVPCMGGFDYDVYFGDTVQFQDMIFGEPVSWHWDFGDGDTSNLPNPVHVFPADGMYYVCLSWSDSSGGCTGTFCDSVAVGISNGMCTADFTAVSLGFGLVQLTNNSTGSLTGYFWDFGDGSTSTQQNPGVHFYTIPGNYAICLTVNDSVNNCFDTYCHNVSTGSSCTANFNYNDNFLNVSFNSTSNTGGGLIILWNWDFGDGSAPETTENPDHTYLNPGTYTVCLNFTKVDPPACTSNIECKDITLVADQVNEIVNANFTNVNLTPNPASGNCVLNYSLMQKSDVRICITDIAGKIISEVNHSGMIPGMHSENISTENLSPGIYLTELSGNQKKIVQKLVILK